MRSITEPDILQRIATLEHNGNQEWAEDWMEMDRQRRNGDFHENSVSWAIANYQAKADALLQDYIDCGDELENSQFDRPFGMPAIYGDGGWNRYYVLLSGEVVFSRHHSTKENQAKAEAAGFRLW